MDGAVKREDSAARMTERTLSPAAFAVTVIRNRIISRASAGGSHGHPKTAPPLNDLFISLRSRVRF